MIRGCIVRCNSIVLYLLWYTNIFFFNDTPTTEIYTLSLHDALPISAVPQLRVHRDPAAVADLLAGERLRLLVQQRSEEHTSELQSQFHLVCRLLLEKKKKK